jgi:hypothetical protein
MKRMVLLTAVLSSVFCLAQDPQVIPQVTPSTPAVSAVAPAKSAQAKEATKPVAPATTQASQHPCKSKTEKTVARKKFPTGSGHEPI